MNESAVLLAGDLAWPVTVLVIATLLLVTQREALGRLIDRIKSLKYPGGEAELGMVAEAGVAVISTAVESLSRDVTVALEPGKRPADGEQIEPVQNREPIGDVEPVQVDEVTSLVVLRTNAAILLEELAYPPPPSGFGSVSATLDILRRRGVLDNEQATSLAQLIEIADEASRGAIVPRRVGQAVQNSGTTIVRQLDKLRAVAGAKFEDHVLITLRQRLPAGWTLDIDRAVPRDETSAESVHARVDALVTAGDRNVVVEIRARLQPGADIQIEAVKDWLAALPPQLPVLLVMLGERLSDRELRWMCAGHEGPIELLLWDRHSSELIGALRELLDRAGEGLRAGLPSQRIAG
ncbi:MAG TPA: hypothetical protein VF070_17420 [Streptosporangiaceae bacterium]